MRIKFKMFLATLTTSALLVGAMYTLVQWSVDRGMLHYVNQRDAERISYNVAQLALYYEDIGHWEDLRTHRTFHNVATGTNDQAPQRGGRDRGMPQGRHGEPRGDGRHSEDRRPHDRRDKGQPSPSRPGAFESSAIETGADPRNLTLFDAQKNIIKESPRATDSDQLYPIEADGELVGWLSLDRREKITDGYELQFLQQQRETLLAISLLVFLISALLALPLAHNLVRPIRQLAAGAEKLSGGDYAVILETQRNDELGQLAASFNELARTLAANEQARRRWFADISHELRTPLAILKGEIEALQDGVRPLSLDRVNSLGEEIQHLTRLVEDLYELSNSDIGALKYRKEVVDFRELVDSVIDHYQPLLKKQQLQLTFHYDAQASYRLWGDVDRLRQMLGNLFSNSIKYSDAGGELRLTLRACQDELLLTLEDSPPGVTTEHLSHLFEHLYRVEQSRNRSSGGSGLGLSICKRIVEAHDGKISAQGSPLGGLSIELALPKAHA